MATIHDFYPQYSQDTQQETKLGIGQVCWPI